MVFSSAGVAASSLRFFAAEEEVMERPGSVVEPVLAAADGPAVNEPAAQDGVAVDEMVGGTPMGEGEDEAPTDALGKSAFSLEKFSIGGNWGRSVMISSSQNVQALLQRINTSRFYENDLPKNIANISRKNLIFQTLLLVNVPQITLRISNRIHPCRPTQTDCPYKKKTAPENRITTPYFHENRTRKPNHQGRTIRLRLAPHDGDCWHTPKHVNNNLLCLLCPLHRPPYPRPHSDPANWPDRFCPAVPPRWTAPWTTVPHPPTGPLRASARRSA